ncbi:hypothetical protein ATSB10_19850 [Dyella thiooxydans]|uniref:Aspartyl protease n=1 Tax=Dyella thiooxydans TaxID=445710 RepID=A0A161IVJ2_9GAMM|nr:hypothetical protein [Dyella thiooxydans]AND69439.1 hypothetical protein ATSB10_19850 [Dyella thiooxydans]
MRRSIIRASLVLAFAFPAAPAAAGALQPMRVPLHLQAGLPTTPATIGGKPVTLFIDVGNYQVVGLKTAVLARLPVKFTGDSESWRDADGHVFTSRIFRAADLEAGALTATQFDGNELVGDTGKAGYPQDGLIGFGLLHRYQMVFDEAGGELRLYPASAEGVFDAECGNAGGPLRLENGVMVSEVQTGHGSLRVQWDTGAAADVLRPSAIAGRDKDADLLRRFTFQRFDVAGQPAGPQAFMMRQFPAPDVDAVLGTGFFASHVVCLDPSHGRVAFRTKKTGA